MVKGEMVQKPETIVRFVWEFKKKRISKSCSTKDLYVLTYRSFLLLDRNAVLRGCGLKNNISG